MSRADALATLIRESRGVQHKRDVAAVTAELGIGGGSDAVPVGDDTAILPQRDGHLLFAIEGFVEDFVAADPWFAGYCGVMVNVSDIMAMGGRPIAVVNALWSASHADAAPLLAGLRDAAQRYGVPIVGGHSNLRAASGQLAVAILGETVHPVTSFDARPGDTLVVATDLRGRFRDPFPWWDASTSSAPQRLRGDMAILPGLAEAGLLNAAKDISMAGVVGTVMMLAETSGVGCAIDLGRLPIPNGVAIERWLTAFPSFGFVMAVRPANVAAVLRAFQQRDVACAAAGRMDDSGTVSITHRGETATVWDFVDPLIGCTRAQDPIVETNHA